jgi:hypothetical protein
VFKKKSLHPGAHLAIDLIVFLALLPALIPPLILSFYVGLWPALLMQLLSLGPGSMAFIVLYVLYLPF